MPPRWLSGFKLPAEKKPRRSSLKIEGLEVRCVPATLTGVEPVSGFELCNDSLPVASGIDPAPSADSGATVGALLDLTQTFKLHSRPGASKVIYLDFDGSTTSGTQWNSSFTGGKDIFTPAFDFDGNTSAFSDPELERIQYIWQRVMEDYSPFDVDVTTEQPALQDLINSGGGDTRWGTRVAIGGNGSWYSSAGGVAYVGSFTWNSDTPAFVFPDNLAAGNEKYTAEAISHEAGHTLGLSHDGTSTAGYYTGYGSGETGWAPIMGVGYYEELTQWSKGEYPDANNKQDDLAIIAGQNGFGYRTDDYGNTLSSAAVATVSGTTIGGSGIIERNTDADWFSFTTGAGTISLTISPAARGADLDILAEIYDSSGNMIATSNPIDSLSATFTMTVPAGQYFLRIDGIGKSDPSTGYSDYGSLGQYSFTGTIVDSGGTPLLSVNDVSASENAGSVQFQVSLSAPATGTVTVGYATADQSTVAGSDYTATTGTLTFNAGEQVKYVTVNLIDDTVSESTETFVLNVTSLSGPAMLGDGQGRANITDDDVPPSPPPPPPPPPADVTVSISDVANNEGNVQRKTGAPAQTAFNFTITLSAASSTPVTVSYSTSDGTAATGDVDYQAISGTVTFAPGETSKTVTVIVLGDTTPEPDETFLVSLTSVSGATINDGTGIGTIRDDDTKGGGGKPRKAPLVDQSSVYVIDQESASSPAQQPESTGPGTVFTRIVLPPQTEVANERAAFLRLAS